MARNKEMLVTTNVVEFDMGVKRDSFGREHEIHVTVNVEKATREQILQYAFSGASLRVKLQSQLRAKPESELAKLAASGLKTTFENIDQGLAKSPVDKLMALSKDDFVDTMVNQLGLTEEKAIEIYNRKHGVVENNAE